MLELYHAEPMANSLKALLGLHEKGVAFTSRFVNLHNFEQHEPAFVRVNPNGQVPVLVHDGKVVTESTCINEYVDEVFDGPALRPADPYGRARMRFWTKFVDEYFYPPLSYIAWHFMIRNITDKLSPADFEAKLARIPLKEQQEKWRTTARQGYTKEQLDEWRRQVRVSIGRLEQQLRETRWLAGDTYSLADIAVFSMALHLPSRWQDDVNATSTPHLLDWHERVSARPAVKTALSMPNPVAATHDAAAKAWKTT
jgi:glutathione S-transferase